MSYKLLKKKILNKASKIGIIGVGYVGIKILIAFNKKKFEINAYDNDKSRIDSLKKGKSLVSYIPDKEIKKTLNNTKYYFKNFSTIKECDVIIICLPTPLKRKKPDLSHLKENFSKISKYLKNNQMIILESTTYPGCTEEIYLPILEKKFEMEKNFFLGYSPERESPGEKKFDFKNTPKIISGYGKNSQNLCKLVYEKIVTKTIPVRTIKIAETTKLLENIYRSINIGLVNELKMFLKKINIDINDVIDAASTKPFGFNEFRPGPGVGGHCIPIDPIYLSWLAKKKGFKTNFIELAYNTNVKTTNWIVKNISDFSKSLKIKKILILGLAYKKNIEDTREAASLKIFKKLINLGFSIDYCDPYVPSYKFTDNKKKIYSVKNSLNKFKIYDAIILCTDHDLYNYKKLVNLNKIIFDLRNKFSSKDKNIIKL